ncbi:MAG: 4-(cytidine 5'-diphospho)-2-C-methyl-D-erythritol kinase, partial [Vulcanimicrobiaceae bacterium]
MPFVVNAPAKINLTLEVLSRRADGYHALRSLMVPLAFGDRLQIEPSERSAFSCSDPALGGQDNLAARAMRALAPAQPQALHLTKHIPTEAGLGGGSSDAAAVLLAAMDGALGTIAPLDYLAVARSLGSDVPFFLARTGALVEGTGERVTAVGTLPNWHVLVVKPPVTVSTADAYARLDRYPRPARARAGSVTLRALAAL